MKPGTKEESQRQAIIDAMMYLEIAGEPLKAGREPDLTVMECVMIAHSILQNEFSGQHSWAGAPNIIAKRIANDLIDRSKD